jgi:Fe-S cluster assembly iron-binding protein IscA
MLTLSYTASECLDLMLAEANVPDDAVVRVVVEGRGVDLGIDIVRPGDTTFDHGGKVVLAIDEQASELLADRKLDVKVTGEESQLVLIEQVEE